MEDRKYTREEAFALDRRAQMSILRERGIKFKAISKESVLVDQILESNGDVEMAKEEIKKVEKEEVKKPVKTFAEKHKKHAEMRAKKDASEMRILERHPEAEVPYNLCQVPGKRGPDGKVTEWRTVTKVIYD